MYSGVVQVTSESASMLSVCWYNGGTDKHEYQFNLFPCLKAYRPDGKDGMTAMDSMAKLFEGQDAECTKGATKCSQLYGIFTSKNSLMGDFGIVNGEIKGKNAVSEATAENEGQFWALCAKKI